MSDTVSKSESKTQKVECYLCNQDVNLSKSMEVPLTTGSTVNVHPSCMEFYLSQTSMAAGGACGSCAGDAGCC